MVSAESFAAQQDLFDQLGTLRRPSYFQWEDQLYGKSRVHVQTYVHPCNKHSLPQPSHFYRLYYLCETISTSMGAEKYRRNAGIHRLK